MNDWRSGMKRLLAVVPAILLVTLVDVFLATLAAGAIFIELVDRVTVEHLWWLKTISILIGIFVYGWLVFGHKLRDYIRG